MKKPICILLSIAAVLACTKTEVAYDDALTGEITISPVAGNITKAAITDGVYPEENHISLFAYHAPDVTATTMGALDYTKFTEGYLYNTEYHYTGSDNSTKIWSGLVSSYYWPITGSLVFAGYSLPAPADGQTASTPIGTVTYDLSADKMVITGYTQSVNTAETFDLLYFGRTAGSYNNRREGNPVQLEFKHALSWITIKVKGGDGALVNGREWSVTNIYLDDVQTIGDFTYLGTSASDQKVTWSPGSDKDDMVIFNSTPAQQLTNAFAEIENKDAEGNLLNGTVVIPQDAKKLYVTITYKSPANDDITETVDIDLAGHTANWEAGKRYTYELTFDPKEIRVAPIVETWPDPIVSPR